jgi:hypothetical protein
MCPSPTRALQLGGKKNCPFTPKGQYIVVVVIIIIHFFTGEIKNEKVENEAIVQAFNCRKVRKIKIKIAKLL